MHRRIVAERRLKSTTIEILERLVAENSIDH
jgi:hypothetical protein